MKVSVVEQPARDKAQLARLYLCHIYTTEKMKRIKEIDFTKGILILLVISFHLVYFEHQYPYAKQVVYTFHMPAFLFISGYLLNTRKAQKAFWRSIFWLAIPYAVMESGYIIMASLLPINEHIDNLNAMVFLDKLLLHPLGPYWYLHTLVLCEAVLYCSLKIKSLSPISQFILACLLLYIVAKMFSIMSFTSAAYFLAGAVIRHTGVPIVSVFKPSILALATFIILVAQPENLSSATITGVLIVYMSMNICILFFKYSGVFIRQVLQYFGRNTMSLYLFSPMFTILCKPLASVLAFDPTGILFLLSSLTICVTGSLLVAIIMDKTRLSRLMFGKKIMSPFIIAQDGKAVTNQP